MFVACRKQKSKWIAVARWTPDNNQVCLATAQSAFYQAGLDANSLHIAWEDSMTRQKNFGGYAQDCKQVTATVAEVERLEDIDRTARAMGFYSCAEDMLQIYDDKAEFIPAATQLRIAQGLPVWGKGR